MAKDEIRNGQAEYGTVHVMEDEMREARQGVFEPKSGERRTRKAAASSAETKMEAAPSNKSNLDHDGDGKAGGSTKGATSTRARGAAKARK